MARKVEPDGVVLAVERHLEGDHVVRPVVGPDDRRIGRLADHRTRAEDLAAARVRQVGGGDVGGGGHKLLEGQSRVVGRPRVDAAGGRLAAIVHRPEAARAAGGVRRAEAALVVGAALEVGAVQRDGGGAGARPRPRVDGGDHRRRAVRERRARIVKLLAVEREGERVRRRLRERERRQHDVIDPVVVGRPVGRRSKPPLPALLHRRAEARHLELVDVAGAIVPDVEAARRRHRQPDAHPREHAERGAERDGREHLQLGLRRRPPRHLEQPRRVRQQREAQPDERAAARPKLAKRLELVP